jgi:cation diffusion facilitator CzcD-associated flavoprotein CzcO
LLHSIEIKDYAEFKDENILIVGTGLSAEDAVLQSYKYGAQ